MKSARIVSLITFLGFAARLARAGEPFAGFENEGLVGVGRVPAAAFDQRGAALETLGGFFSGMAFDPATLRMTDDPARGGVLTGELFGLADRGFGDGAMDYRPRFHTFLAEIVPDYTSWPAAQNQITLRPIATRLFHDEKGADFTGCDADPKFTLYPRSFRGDQLIGEQRTPGSLGAGRRSLDAEGLVLLRDGSLWVADEYGPLLHHFTRDGVLLETLTPPAALLPRKGPRFGARANDFGASVFSAETGQPDSGRADNRGFEGLAITPDEKRLVAALQSPLVQDSGTPAQKASALFTRLLFFDLEPGSVTRGKVVAEYVYALHRTNTEGHPQTTLSDLLALNDHQFLALEHDGFGRGQTKPGPDATAPQFKRVVLVEVNGATNLAGTGYDLEKGAPGQLSLPADSLPADITPVTTRDFIDLLDGSQLARFGLNAKSHQDSDENTLAEKWEGLAIVPLRDPVHPDDVLLLVGNDNDFKARKVFHEGEIVATNDYALDTMILAYRVALPEWRTNLETAK